MTTLLAQEAESSHKLPAGNQAQECEQFRSVDPPSERKDRDVAGGSRGIGASSRAQSPF